MWRRVWSWYNTWNTRKPLLTQAITCGVLYGAGDVVAQRIERYQAVPVSSQEQKGNHGEESGFDVPRTMRLASFGAALDAPILKSWYDLLDKYIPRADARAVAVKLVLDQVFCAPLIYVLFFPYLGFLKGASIAEIKEKIQRDFLTTYLADCALWLPAGVINFKFVPPAFRVLYVSAVSFVWSIYLAFVGGAD